MDQLPSSSCGDIADELAGIQCPTRLEIMERRPDLGIRGEGNRRKETVRDGNHRGGEIKNEGNRMTREQTIEAIKVMQAFVDGNQVERRLRRLEGWNTTDNPSWNWTDCIYRIKPTPVLRPWTADEVPLGMQTRNREYPKTRWLIDRTSSTENRKDWCEKCEHSTDGGVTWKPCGVVEEAK